jgi:hypothetical protein
MQFSLQQEREVTTFSLDTHILAVFTVGNVKCKVFTRLAVYKIRQSSTLLVLVAR